MADIEAIQALSQEPTEKPMCDRNICISNEYNGIGCDECIVNKAEQEPCEKCEVGNPCLYCEHEFSQKIEPCDDAISREALITKLVELIKTERSTIEIKTKLIPMIQNMPCVRKQ